MRMVPLTHADTGRSRRIAFDLRYALFTVAYVAMISWFSAHPEPKTSGSGPLAQLAINAYRLPLYAGLGFFVLQTISRGQALAAHRWSRVGFTFAATGVVAMLEEWRQVFISGREASLFDVLLDLAGVACLLLVCALGTAHASRS